MHSQLLIKTSNSLNKKPLLLFFYFKTFLKVKLIELFG